MRSKHPTIINPFSEREKYNEVVYQLNMRPEYQRE
jgi:hypothetical protein